MKTHQEIEKDIVELQKFIKNKVPEKKKKIACASHNKNAKCKDCNCWKNLTKEVYSS